MLRAVIFATVALALCCQRVVAQETSPKSPEGSGAEKQLPFPKDFDPTRYLGRWYEVARLPNPAQPAESLAAAEYSAGENEGEVIVKNSAYTAEGKLISAIKGKAQLLPSDPPRLAVSFGPIVPKEPNYFVIHVDGEYQHAVVGTPDRKSLWILTRKVPIAERTRESLFDIAKEAGFDTQKILIGEWKAEPSE